MCVAALYEETASNSVVEIIAEKTATPASYAELFAGAQPLAV